MESLSVVLAPAPWRRLAIGLTLAVTVVPLKPPSPALAAPAPERVKMIHFEFDPAEVTVPVGTAVTWTYDESASDPQPNCESPQFQAGPVTCPGHSTTAVDKAADGKPLWDSGVHRADGFPFTYTFTTPGTFRYFCTVHGGENPNNPITQMNGTVVVEAAASPSAAPTTAAAPPPAPARSPSAAAAPASGSEARPGGLAPTGGTGFGAVGLLVLGIALLVRGVTSVCSRDRRGLGAGPGEQA